MQHPDEGTIHAWLDQALPPDESAHVAGHVAACQACAQAVAEARGFIAASSRILSALDEVPAGVIPPRDAVVPGDALSALRARRARQREATRRHWWSRPRAVAAASVTFLAVASGSILMRSAYGPQPSRGGGEPAAVISADAVAPDSMPTSVGESTASTARPAEERAAVEAPAAPPSAIARGAEPAAPLPAPTPAPTTPRRSLADRAEAGPPAASDSQRQTAKAETSGGDSLGNPRDAADVAQRRARADEPGIAAIQQQAAERQQAMQQGLDPRLEQRRLVAPPSPLPTSAAGRATPTVAPGEADLAASRPLAQQLAGCYHLSPVTGVAPPYALPSELSLDTVAVAVAGDSSWRRAVPARGAQGEFAWRPRTAARVDLVMQRVGAPVPVSAEIRTGADSPRQAPDGSLVAVLVRVSCAR